VSGDYRLREEHFHRGTAGKIDRDRQRFRLRLGLELPMPENFALKTRFATGTGEQVSTNQTFAGLGSQKSIWVDRASLEWKALPFLKLAGGRMANPLWTQYSSDIVWDDDFNPEGFAESVDYLLAGKINLFANALQMAADEDSTVNRDQWLLSHQIGAEVRLPLQSRLRVAYALHDWIHENTRGFLTASTATVATVAPFGQGVVQNGNRRALGATALANDFLVHEITAQLGFWIPAAGREWPVSLQGTYIVNGQARTGSALGTDALDEQNRGYQAGGILGKASDKNSLELAYFYKKSETDATVADVADSDFGNGGTNRKGHILWIAYNPQEWLQLKAKYFITRTAEAKLSPGADDINRLQIDASVKF
jgi:hypothetical protein